MADAKTTLNGPSVDASLFQIIIFVSGDAQTHNFIKCGE